MKNPVVLPDDQRLRLRRACLRFTVRTLARTLGMHREVIAKLAGGLPCKPGSVALYQSHAATVDAMLDASATPPRAA